MKNSLKTAGRKQLGFTEGSSTTTSREARLNSRSACKNKLIQKNQTLLQKLKELAAEAEDDKEIVSELIPQEDSDKSRDHITTNSTVIPVLICQTGYTSPMIVHSLENFARKKDRYDIKNWVRLEKGDLKMTWCGSHSKPDSSSGRR